MCDRAGPGSRGRREKMEERSDGGERDRPNLRSWSLADGERQSREVEGC